MQALQQEDPLIEEGSEREQAVPRFGFGAGRAAGLVVGAILAAVLVAEVLIAKSNTPPGEFHASNVMEKWCGLIFRGGCGPPGPKPPANDNKEIWGNHHGPGQCSCGGDPHCYSITDKRFDFYLTGEHVYYSSSSMDINVNVFTCPFNRAPVTAIIAVSASIKGFEIQILQGKVMVDGKVMTKSKNLGKGVELEMNFNSYIVSTGTDGGQMMVKRINSQALSANYYFDVIIKTGETSGVDGVCASSSAAEISASWGVSQSKSFFSTSSISAIMGMCPNGNWQGEKVDVLKGGETVYLKNNMHGTFLGMCGETRYCRDNGAHYDIYGFPNKDSRTKWLVEEANGFLFFKQPDHEAYLGFCGGANGCKDRAKHGTYGFKYPNYLEKTNLQWQMEKSGGKLFLKNPAHGTYLGWCGEFGGCSGSKHGIFGFPLAGEEERTEIVIEAGDGSGGPPKPQDECTTQGISFGKAESTCGVVPESEKNGCLFDYCSCGCGDAATGNLVINQMAFEATSIVSTMTFSLSVKTKTAGMNLVTDREFIKTISMAISVALKVDMNAVSVTMQLVQYSQSESFKIAISVAVKCATVSLEKKIQKTLDSNAFLKLCLGKIKIEMKKLKTIKLKVNGLVAPKYSTKTYSFLIDQGSTTFSGSLLLAGDFKSRVGAVKYESAFIFALSKILGIEITSKMLVLELKYKDGKLFGGFDLNCGCGASKIKGFTRVLQSSSNLQVFVQQFMVKSSITISNVEFTDAKGKATSVIVKGAGGLSLQGSLDLTGNFIKKSMKKYEVAFKYAMSKVLKIKRLESSMISLSFAVEAGKLIGGFRLECGSTALGEKWVATLAANQGLMQFVTKFLMKVTVQIRMIEVVGIEVVGAVSKKSGKGGKGDSRRRRKGGKGKKEETPRGGRLLEEQDDEDEDLEQDDEGENAEDELGQVDDDEEALREAPDQAYEEDDEDDEDTFAIYNQLELTPGMQS